MINNYDDLMTQLINKANHDRVYSFGPYALDDYTLAELLSLLELDQTEFQRNNNYRLPINWMGIFNSIQRQIEEALSDVE